ncbi:MAG TPA: AraC family transcriptional regulator [Solirubrobacter sp.]|jgi:AraC-like DNA-binding protein|nr:AraC family transcriptional regulator [Solirubrobacter sp.]
MTRIVRHASELDRWEMAFGMPDPRLRGYVHSYCAYDERTGSFVRRRELPSDRVVGIINLGAPIRVLTDQWTSQDEGFVAGLHDTYAVTETRGAQRGVQIDFSAEGAYLLFRVPMHEFTHRVVTLSELLGRAGEFLREALEYAPTAEAKFALLDDFFLDRLDDALSPVPTITRALGRLRATAGAIPVSALADEVGCSRRYLAAGFREHVGISPKLLARILRFRRALGLMEQPLSWAEISHACGYYDQAHLIRDFKQFTGSAPEEFARRRLPDGGGVVGD